MSTQIKAATGAEIDEAFERGEDMGKYFDLSAGVVEKPANETRRININMPKWLIEAIDGEAEFAGANRQSYINMTLTKAVEDAKRQRIA